MANDGSLVFDTELDTSGFEKGTAKFEKAFNSLRNATVQLGKAIESGFSTPKQAEAFQARVEKVKDSVAQLESQINELGQQTISTADYENVTKAIEKAEKALFKLYAQKGILEELGVDESSTQWRRLQIQIRDAEAELARFEKAKKSMEASGQAFVSGSETEEYQRLSTAIADVTDRLNGYQAAAQQVKTGGTAGKISLLKTALEKVGKAAKGAVSWLKKFLFHSNKSALSAKDLLKPLLSLKSMLFTRAKRMFISYIYDELKSAMTALQKYSSAFGSAMNNMKNSCKMLGANLSVTFGNLVAAIEPAVTQIVNIISTAITYLNAFFALLSGKSTMTVAKKQMKDYTEETDAAAKAAKELNKQLMGFDEINRLNAPKEDSSNGTNPDDLFEEVPIDSILPDYVKNFFQQLKAAFEAGDWVAIGSIIAGGLNQGMAAIDTWINSTFRPLAATWAERIATMLNHFIAGYDWALLGKTVADGISAGVNAWWKFATTFNFEALGTRIATAINSALATMSIPDETGLNAWQKLGQALSRTVNGLLTAINNALQNVDWFAVGQSIGDFISSIDWGSIAWNFTKLAGGIVEGIGAALAGWTDTSPISAALATLLTTAFAGIKLGPILTATVLASSLKNGAVGAGGAGIGGIAGAAAGAASTVATALSGIGSIVSGAVIAITNFFSMLKTGFSWVKEALMLVGTALAAVGAVILGAPATIAAVIAAIVAAVATSAVVIKEHWQEICAWFEGFTNDLKTGWDNFINGIKAGWANFSSGFMSDMKRFGNWLGSIWQGLIDGIVADWNNLVDGVMAIWTETKIKFNDFVESFKAFGKNVVEGFQKGISEFFSNPISWIKTHIFDPFINGFKSLFGIASPSKVMMEQGGFITDGLLKGLTDTWGNITSFFGDAVSGIKEALSSGWNAIKGHATSAWESIKTTVTGKFTATQQKLESSVSGISTSVTSGWSNIKSTTSSLWNATSESVSAVFSAMQSRLGGSMSSLMTALTNGWRTIQNTTSTTWTTISSTVQGKWNDLQSVLRRTDWASIGSGICSGIRNGINAGWQWLKSTVSDLASSLLRSAKSALGIHSPSRVFRDEVGRNVGLGLAEGISDTEQNVAATVSNLAKTAVDAFGNPELTADVAGAEMVNGLDAVAERLTTIVDSFQAIASILEALGGLLMPDIAVGTVVPPKIKSAVYAAENDRKDYIGGSDVADRIVSALIQVSEAIIKSIDEKDMSVSIGDDAIWDAYRRYDGKMGMIRGY